MERHNCAQLELFTQSKSQELKTYLPAHFLSFIRQYERVMILAISFILTCVISFSLGVEKGKRIAKSLIPNNSQIKINPPNIKINNEQGAPVLDKPVPKVKEFIENYTIQVATYKTKTSAQTEAETLRKKGFLPLVLPKSGYIVLCVGNFSNKETAGVLLSQLRKLYRDCFVRRL